MTGLPVSVSCERAKLHHGEQAAGLRMVFL